jgi:hypothetical protein
VPAGPSSLGAVGPCLREVVTHYLFSPGGAFPDGFRFGGAVVSGAAGAESGGADPGAGSGGSFSTAGPLAVEAGGVVTAGVAANDGATGAAVVGTGLVSDRAGRSPSLSRTVMDPKPTSSAATHANGSQTARLPIR